MRREQQATLAPEPITVRVHPNKSTEDPKTCVKKSAQTRPHSKQVRLGYIRLGLTKFGLLG